MSAEVIALLPNTRPIIPGKPDPDVVELLEGFLIEAKAGRIVAVAIAAIEPEGAQQYGITAAGNTKIALGGAVLALQTRIASRIIND